MFWPPKVVQSNLIKMWKHIFQYYTLTLLNPPSLNGNSFISCPDEHFCWFHTHHMFNYSVVNASGFAAWHGERFSFQYCFCHWRRLYLRLLRRIFFIRTCDPSYSRVNHSVLSTFRLILFDPLIFISSSQILSSLFK